MNKFPTGRNLNSLVKKVAFDALYTGAEGILPDIIDETPIKSGTLRRSQIVSPVRSRMTVVLSANTPYAHALHEGTKPYDITPTNKKALAFTAGGETIIRKRIHHPGRKGNPWMRKTVQLKLSTMGKYIASKVTKALPEGLE